MVLASAGILPIEWTIWRTGGGKREEIGTVPGVPECMADGETTLHCVVLSAQGTTLWRIEGGTTLTLLGTLPREYDMWRVSGENRVVAAGRDGGPIAVLDAGAARGTLLSRPDSADGANSFMIDAATAPGIVAALTTQGEGSALTLYRVR